MPNNSPSEIGPFFPHRSRPSFATVLLWAAAYLLALVLHELGHLAIALLAGIRVERVFIGLDAGDFAIIRLRHKHTTWGLGWLPIGAYIKLTGLPYASFKTPPSFDFRSRSLLIRATLVAMGPAVNITAAAIALQTGQSLWDQPFATMNIWIGIWNLVPRPGTDGHHLLQMLKAVLFSPYRPGPTSQP